MDFNTTLVLIIAIVSTTILGLSAIGAYREYKSGQRDREERENDK